MTALLLLMFRSDAVAYQIEGSSGDFSAMSLFELWWLSCMGLRIQLGIVRKNLLYSLPCEHWDFCVVVGQTLIDLEQISISSA